MLFLITKTNEKKCFFSSTNLQIATFDIPIAFDKLIQQTFQYSCKVYPKLSIHKKLTNIIIFSLGEGNNVTGETTNLWKETTLQTILSSWPKTEIYNADEFGLLYHALPKNTLHTKDEKCTGGKLSKVRLTGLAAANMNGDELPMFIIGQLNNPWCFKQVEKLLCRCRAQKKSWMDSQRLKEWVRELEYQFFKKNRKVALIIDNCTPH